jgi:hypothetical protein
MVLTAVIGYCVAAILGLAWAISSGRVSAISDRDSSADFKELAMRLGSWRRRRSQRRSRERRLQLMAVDEERRSSERRTADRRSDQAISDPNPPVSAIPLSEVPLGP